MTIPKRKHLEKDNYEEGKSGKGRFQKRKVCNNDSSEKEASRKGQVLRGRF